MLLDRQARIAAFASELERSGISIVPAQLERTLNDPTLSQNAEGISDPIYNLAKRLGADPEVFERALVRNHITGNINPADDILQNSAERQSNLELAASHLTSRIRQNISSSQLTSLMQWANDQAQQTNGNPMEIFAKRFGVNESDIRGGLTDGGFVAEDIGKSKQIVAYNEINNQVRGKSYYPAMPENEMLLDRKSPDYQRRYEENQTRYDQNKARMEGESQRGLIAQLAGAGIHLTSAQWESRLSAANETARTSKGDAMSILANNLGIDQDRLTTMLEKNHFASQREIIPMSGKGQWGIAGEYSPIGFNPSPEIFTGVNRILLQNEPQGTYTDSTAELKILLGHNSPGPSEEPDHTFSWPKSEPKIAPILPNNKHPSTTPGKSGNSIVEEQNLLHQAGLDTGGKDGSNSDGIRGAETKAAEAFAEQTLGVTNRSDLIKMLHDPENVRKIQEAAQAAIASGAKMDGSHLLVASSSPKVTNPSQGVTRG